MSVELLKSIFDWVTVVLIGLTVVSGAGALITGDIIGKRQAKEIEELKNKTGELESANLTLRGQIAGLESKAAQQQERAATAETELLRLKERIKPRHLSGSEQKALTAKLLPFAGQISMLVTLSGDPEIVGIGNDLIAAIKEAHWDLTTVLGNAPHGEVRSGIVVEIGPDAPEPAIRAASVLASALRSAGLATDGPNSAERTLRAGGATFNPPPGPALTDTRLITVTIAKKP